MEEQKKKSKAPIVFLVLILIIAAGVGGFFGGKYYFENNNKLEQKENQQEQNTNEEQNNNEPEKEDDGTITEEKKKLAEKLLLPFIRTSSVCYQEGYFFEKDNYTVDTIDKDILLTTAFLYANEFNTNKTSTGIEPDYPDILVKDIEEAIKNIYGKKIELTMPKQFNDEYNFESYVLKGDRYTLEAQGGGCTEYTSYISSNIKSIKQSDTKVVIDVQYQYIIYKEEDTESDIVPTFNSYKDKDLKELIVSNVSGEKEEETIKELYNNNKTNYYSYTFVKDSNGNYILESIVKNRV